MEKDIGHRRSSYFSGGGCMSPSCLPVQEEIEYTRMQCCSSRNNSNNSKRSRRWRNYLRRLVKDGKSSIYGSKPLPLNYDAVSYSQNFDEGCHYYEESRYCPKLLREVRWVELHE